MKTPALFATFTFLFAACDAYPIKSELSNYGYFFIELDAADSAPPDAEGDWSQVAYGTFYGDGKGKTPKCRAYLLGDCTLERCTNVEEALSRPPSINGGEIVLSGGNSTPTTFTSDADAKFNYGPTPLGKRFAPGDAISISASGNSSNKVPAFNTSVVAPSVLTLPKTEELTEISKSKDFKLKWQNPAGIEGHAIFSMNQDSSKRFKTDEMVHLFCAFDAKKGNGTVPSSMISEFDIGTYHGFMQSGRFIDLRKDGYKMTFGVGNNHVAYSVNVVK